MKLHRIWELCGRSPYFLNSDAFKEFFDKL